MKLTEFSTKDIIETILLVNNLQLRIKDDIYNNLTGNCLIEGQVELKNIWSLRS